MAKSKAKVANQRTTVTTVRTTAPDDDDEIRLSTPESIPDQDELAALMELGSETEVRWKVTKLSEPNSGYCGDYSSNELSLSRIQEDWGGGRYRIRGVNDRGQFVGQRDQKIADKPRSQQLQVMQQQPQQDLQAQMYKMMLDAARDQSSMLQNLLTSMINRPAAQSSDPLAMIAALKDILKPEKSDGGIDVLLRGLELGKELSGDGSGDNWTGIVGKGIDTFKPLIDRIAANQPQARPRGAPAAEAAPAPNPQLPAPGTIPATQGDDMNVIQMAKILPWLQAQVKALLVQAQRDKEPALYAAVFLDNLPEFVPVELILQRFSQPNAIDELGSINAGVLRYREWFEEFRIEVLNAIQEAAAEANQSQEFTSGISATDPIGGETLEHDDGG
jgi:hypothetical protein